MKTFKTIIVDDEPLARQHLKRLVSEDRELILLEVCGNGYEVIRALEATIPDILFLDIQMPEINGFDVLKKIDYSKIPAIIFVTAFNEYAVRAFEVHALDYLLKPFDRNRFVEAVKRAKIYINTMQPDHLDMRINDLVNELNVKDKSGSNTRIMVKSSGRAYFIQPDEIEWIEAAGNYVKIYAGGKSHLIRETMTHLEQKLDSNMFSRIHRSTIVNIDKIKEMQPWFHGDYTVMLQSGKKLTMSRKYKELLQRY